MSSDTRQAVRPDEEVTMDSTFSPTGDRMTPGGVLTSPHRVETLRIDYEPGGSTQWPHRHAFGAYVYVIDGAVRMGLEGEEPQVLEAGDTLYEPPGTLHVISENASATEPASLLAAFVVPAGDRGQRRPVVIP